MNGIEEQCDCCRWPDDAQQAQARIAALEAEVSREHEAACALTSVIMEIGEILGADVDTAECAGTVKAAKRIEAEVERLQRHLESLTPGGSEFHNNPARCVLWSTQQREGVIHQVKLRKAAEAEVARLRVALASLLLVTHDSYSPTCGCEICRAVEVGRAELERQKGAGDG